MHAVWFAEDAGLRDLAASLLLLKFEGERLVDMPIDVSLESVVDFGTITLPSAQSIIWSNGSRALYIVVVLHHIGRPKNITITQKDRITKARSRMLSGFSGGGSFFFGAAVTAFAGASSPFSALRSASRTPASDFA
jgi:hypothetical protein